MIKQTTLIIIFLLSISYVSYASMVRLTLELPVMDSTEIDSSQININVLKHSVGLVCYDKTVAYIDTLSGMVRGMNKSKMGMFISNGNVKDARGHLIGEIDGNQFKDADKTVVGSINSSGEVFDMNNMKIGEINSSNEIIDANNSVIGKVESNVDNRWLAAYFFFFFTTI